MTKHESFATLDEAADAIAEYLPGRKPQSPQRLTRNLRQRPDGRWEWKHGLGRGLRAAAAEQPSDYEPGIGARSLREWTRNSRGSRARCSCCEGSAVMCFRTRAREEVAALVPNARLATISAAGHLAAGDNPETTTSLVRGFLDDVGW